MAPKFVVNLTEDERLGLQDLLKKPLRNEKRNRIQALLLTDEGCTDEEIVQQVGISRATVERLRRRAVLQGIEAALERASPRTISNPGKLDGRGQAFLAHLACSEPPKGHSRWTLTLLTDALVELQVVPSIGRTTVWRQLKKTTSSRGK